MSRIGKKPIAVPAGVETSIGDSSLTVKGPKGMLEMKLPPDFDIRMEGASIVVVPRRSDAMLNSLHGLYRRLIFNMVEGVSNGYSKHLEIQGVGFKCALSGRKASFMLGFSSPVELDIPESVEFKVTENVNIIVSGPDKQKVGDFAARIRSLYPAEPYKGKGVRYKGEYVKRKVGKTVA